MANPVFEMHVTVRLFGESVEVSISNATVPVAHLVKQALDQYEMLRGRKDLTAASNDVIRRERGSVVLSPADIVRDVLENGDCIIIGNHSVTHRSNAFPWSLLLM